MEDMRKIKDIYDCVAIISQEELYPLQKWYNQLIEKYYPKCIRQKCSAWMVI